MYDIIHYNYSWMILKLLLALIPVFLAWISYFFKNKILKACIFFLWLIFIPNTIYVLTDIIYLIRQIHRMSDPYLIAYLIMQYFVLFMAGVFTFIFALYPIENILLRNKNIFFRKKLLQIIIAINFLIGVAIVLGRVYRVFSIDIFVNPEKVFYSLTNLISMPEMIILAVLFGLLANFIYFLLRKRLAKFVL